MTLQQKGVSNEDVEKIRQMIIKDESGTPFGKRVMIYMLQASQNLTIAVGINFNDIKFRKKGREATDTVHFIKALRWQILGTKFGFASYHNHSLRNGRDGEFCCLSPDYDPDDEKIKILKLDWKTINQISLD